MGALAGLGGHGAARRALSVIRHRLAAFVAPIRDPFRISKQFL